jgi:predicted dehydrogenase
MIETARIGFLGAGGIAQPHAYALETLKYYYSDVPAIEKIIVASPTTTSRERFARRFGFREACSPDEIWDRNDIDTLYILGPNHTHTSQLLTALEVPSIKRIYLEKPIGASKQDLIDLEALQFNDHDKWIITGFQYLHKSALRAALAHWQTGEFGEPIHFRVEYLHSSYLDYAYRKKHTARMAPIPANGAAVDLGTHALSLLIAFMGENLVVRTAAASGQFDDVPHNTDLCTTVMLEEPKSGAIGTLVASRVSQGTGDHMLLEIWAKQGTLIFDSAHPDVYETYTPEHGWQRHNVMSNYLPSSNFPSDYTPSGWLRALVHNHYLFLSGKPDISYIPDLQHGIQVQRLIHSIADHLLLEPHA